MVVLGRRLPVCCTREEGAAVSRRGAHEPLTAANWAATPLSKEEEADADVDVSVLGPVTGSEPLMTDGHAGVCVCCCGHVLIASVAHS